MRVYPYNGSNVKFDSSANTDTKRYHWNQTAKAKDGKEYNQNYYPLSASPLSVSGADTYRSSSGRLNVTYNMTLNARGGQVYNVKEKLAKGRKQDIYDLLDNPSPEAVKAMNLMDPGSGSYSPSVQGYLYFMPIVIEYQTTETVEVPDPPVDPPVDPEEPDVKVTASLELPQRAPIGEKYIVRDVTVLPTGSQLKRTKQERKKKPSLTD